MVIVTGRSTRSLAVMANDIEARFVGAFVVPRMRERWHLKLNDRSRHVHLQRLNHNFDFAPKKATQLKVSRAKQQDILGLLRSKGSPDEIHMLSAREEFDGKSIRLSEVLKQRWHIPSATVLICIPETLALYCDDAEDMYLLENRP
jgi:hypothetical protein